MHAVVDLPSSSARLERRLEVDQPLPLRVGFSTTQLPFLPRLGGKLPPALHAFQDHLLNEGHQRVDDDLVPPRNTALTVMLARLA